MRTQFPRDLSPRRDDCPSVGRFGENQLWVAEWPGAMSVPFMAKRNGDWIRSTPAYDGQSVYVAGMRDVLVCLDAGTGAERWRVNFVEQFKSPLPAFGFVCSPLVVGDHVFVQAAAGFCKLDKRTGQVVWRILADGGGMFGSAFSSPVLATVCGQEQLLVQTRTRLAGILPESGQILWSQDIPAMLGMNILTPTVRGDTIFTSAYGGGSQLLEILSSAASASVVFPGVPRHCDCARRNGRHLEHTALRHAMWRPALPANAGEVKRGFPHRLGRRPRAEQRIACGRLPIGIRPLWSHPPRFAHGPGPQAVSCVVVRELVAGRVPL